MRRTPRAPSASSISTAGTPSTVRIAKHAPAEARTTLGLYASTDPAPRPMAWRPGRDRAPHERAHVAGIADRCADDGEVDGAPSQPAAACARPRTPAGVSRVSPMRAAVSSRARRHRCRAAVARATTACTAGISGAAYTASIAAPWSSAAVEDARTFGDEQPRVVARAPVAEQLPQPGHLGPARGVTSVYAASRASRAVCDEGAERRRLAHREIGEDLAVDVDLARPSAPR